ncbi:MAG: hypothetical protein DWQ08_15170 [Proteobacteria bacterium]|nr:MAG: hypothetical protein DWQ08_15170 [Pseudomonadota bacterium]
MKRKHILTIAAIIAAMYSVAAPSATDRWYSDDLAADGERVYRQNCITCHLEAGKGTSNWQKRDDEGNLPPPPLNGSAHTWHHDIKTLVRTILEGGAKFGGSMPGFKDKLSAREIASVIAYVQSLWPEEKYGTWANAYPDDAETGIPISLEEVSAPAENAAVKARLERLVSAGTPVGDPESTPIAGILGVEAGPRYFYLDDSGRYLILGEMIDLESGENLTELRLAEMRREKLSQFSNEDKVIFPASGEEQAVLDVFTDTICPYCRRLHAEVPELQSAGVTVRYLPFPRSGPEGPGSDEIRSVWCAEDPAAQMTAAKSQSDFQPSNTDCDRADLVEAGYNLGVELGVNGTPAIILPNGLMIPGYRPYQELLQVLGVQQ